MKQTEESPTMIGETCVTSQSEQPSREVAHFQPWLLFSFVLLAAWMVFIFHGGEVAFIRIHDCLDSNIPHLSLFAQSDAFFAGNAAVYQPLLGGIPRNCMPSETNLFNLPYRWLNAIHAYVFCDFAARAIALFGMVLLLRKHLIPDAANIAVFGPALCFALLPFYPSCGLSVAGQPLLLYAALNIRNGDLAFHNWLAVVLFPFCSSVVAIGFVLVPLFGLLFLNETLFRRKAAMPLFVAFALLTAGYLAAEYRLFIQVFAKSGFVPHRVEFASPDISLVKAVKESVINFLYGQHHAASVQYPVILLACATACVVWMWRKRRWENTSLRDANCDGEARSCNIIGLLAILTLCGLISLFFGLYDWSAVVHMILATNISLLRTMQFQRVHWLHPMLWSLAFAFALAVISRKSRLGIAAAAALIVLQAGAEYRDYADLNIRQSLTCSGNPNLRLSFAQFFSTPLFNEIRDYIGRPQSEYRVVSLGLFPAIPFYNGFYTADGYAYNYALDYKHRFRKVMANELAEDEGNRSYFDDWGSRCYLFSHELGRSYLYTKKNPKRSVDHLGIDIAALENLGVQYIVSAVKINNSESLHLKLEKIFERDDSPWQIYLYSVPRSNKIEKVTVTRLSEYRQLFRISSIGMDCCSFQLQQQV